MLTTGCATTIRNHEYFCKSSTELVSHSIIATKISSYNSQKRTFVSYSLNILWASVLKSYSFIKFDLSSPCCQVFLQ